jgi:hypothetical protein
LREKNVDLTEFMTFVSPVDITEILLKVAFNPITPTATMTHYPDSEPTNLGLTPEYALIT